MLTLTYGFKKPEANDKGPTIFPAMEQNIQQLNDHTHDGSNSPRLNASSVATVSQTVPKAGWLDLTNGNYHQQVTMLPGFSYDTSVLSFRNPDGSYVYPSVTKISPSVFDVTSNDPTSDMIVSYGV